VIVLVNEIGAKMTNFQIVGRGLRQPNKCYFKNPELNSLLVFASGIEHNDALNALREFLAGEGLDTLSVDGDQGELPRVDCRISAEFSAPMLELDHDRAWFDSMGVVRMTRIPPTPIHPQSFLDHTLARRASITSYEVVSRSSEELAPVGLVSEAADPYLWRCRFIARLIKLMSDMFTDSVAVSKWVEGQAESFLGDPHSGQMLQHDPEGAATFVYKETRRSFEKHRSEAFLEALGLARCGLWKFDSSEISLYAEKTKDQYKSFQNSVIGDIPKSLFNSEELNFAYYLDETGLKWMRNHPAKGWYYLPGGLSGRFYPDFIILCDETRPGAFNKVVLIETKGGHLIDSLDSREKRRTCEEITRISGGTITAIFDGFDKAKERLNEIRGDLS
jgi:hypothetical protein